MTEVHAQSDYGIMDSYETSYGKDIYNYNKDSNTVSINKIKCINYNININGENTGDINAGNNGLATESSFGNYGERYNNGYYDEWYNNMKGKSFDCVINNNNNNTNTNIIGIGNQTIPPEEPTDNNVYVVWEEGTRPIEGEDDVEDDDIPGTREIFFAASNDNGQTFNPSINLSKSTGDSFLPQIASEGNNLYVVWEDETPGGGNRDIFLVVSNDNGQNFSSPPENLSNSTALSENAQISSSTS